MQFFKSAEPPAMAHTVSPSPLQFMLGPQILDINSRGLPQYSSFFWGSFYSCSASGYSVSACVTGISPRLDHPFLLVLVVVDPFPDKQFLLKDNSSYTHSGVSLNIPIHTRIKPREITV